jgi:predicted RNase H-like HicB family nuclease
MATTMRPQRVTVHTWQESDWWVAQCIEIDVASQGRTESEALDNVREALDLYFEEPLPTVIPQVHTLELAVA